MKHLIFFAAYSGLSLLAALFALEVQAPLPSAFAATLGGLLFVTGALVHEIYVRAGRETLFGQQLLALRDRFYDLQESQQALARDLERLRAVLPAPGGSGSEAMVAELRLMRNALSRLEGSRTSKKAPPEQVSDRREPIVGQSPLAASPRHHSTPGSAVPDALTLLSRDQLLDAVEAALRDDRVDLVLQPIVTLPQRKRAFYECFSRLRTDDGEVIVPEQYISLAREAGLIVAIDNMLLFRCVQLLRKVQRNQSDVGFFCNISHHTLADDEFFGDFTAFLADSEQLGQRLVFEFAQSDFGDWRPEELGGLERLARLGCRFSLDRVQDYTLVPEALVKHGFAFVKLDAASLLKAPPSIHSFIAGLRRAGLEVIVEKIEEEAALKELLEYGIDLGQGYLFGEPRYARLNG
ncbi:MAG: EAL domain-containing protein [Kiloniellales bacterium]